MPIYEYKCKACNRLTSNFVRNTGNEVAPACRHCGARTARTFWSFPPHNSEAKAVGCSWAMADSPEDYRNPDRLCSSVEEKFDDYGMDLPDEARTMIDGASEGELPDPSKTS